MNNCKDKPVFCVIFPFDPMGEKAGGAEIFLKDVIKYLPSDMDIEVIGVSNNPDKSILRKWHEIKFENKTVKFFPVFFEKHVNKRTFIPLSLRFSLALMFLKKKWKFENKVLFFNRIEPVLIFRNTKCVKIGIIHNDIVMHVDSKNSEILWSKIPGIYFTFERFVFSKLDHIFTVNKNSLDFYYSRYKDWKNKISFLPTWVDVDIFSAGDKPKLSYKEEIATRVEGVSAQNKWILFIGRLEKQKNPLLLVDSFNKIVEKNPNMNFLIIGTGSMMEEMKKHVNSFSAGKVFFLGNVKHKEIANYYRASDVFLLTSNFEGMPICVSEALACGLPVVATDVGEVKRVIKNDFSGEVVKSFCPEEISETVIKVVGNSEKYSLENCKQSISEYVPEKVVNKFYELVKGLIWIE